MKVVHVAFECAPIYKTGGLGDVVGALPKFLQKEGIDVSVIIPHYHWIKQVNTIPNTSIPITLIESDFFNGKLKKNDRVTTSRAFAYFAYAVLEELKRKSIKPDIIHCHDWHTGLIPLLLKKSPDAYFQDTKTLLTIHNIGYQGIFSLKNIEIPELKPILTCLNKQQKKISFLKEGIENADYISTVSPNHAHEIRSGKISFGLKKVIRRKYGKFKGIINGIDYSVWNPAKDEKIIKHYSLQNAINGKSENKLHLQKKLDIEVNRDIPLFGFIARLTEQKGLDLILPLLQLLPKKRIQVVILGAGDKKIEKQLLDTKKQIDSGWYSVNVKFDEDLAHEIYAASDFFLIPSKYEPCGLTQMIAMAYGSIPIASAIGGLKDTIIDGKTGFFLPDLTSDGVTQAVEKATNLWQETKNYSLMVDNAMKKNFSWKKSAQAYIRVYREILLKDN